ncbi:transposase [Bradyrhizobium sp. 147]|nr:transposase [Bradyrhizobium sp. 147]
MNETVSTRRSPSTLPGAHQAHALKALQSKHGKTEPFNQTALPQWASAEAYQHQIGAPRAAIWFDQYNEAWPHSTLGWITPCTPSACGESARRPAKPDHSAGRPLPAMMKTDLTNPGISLPLHEKRSPRHLGDRCGRYMPAPRCSRPSPPWRP